MRFKIVRAELFMRLLAEAKHAHQYGCCVTLESLAKYQQSHCFVCQIGDYWLGYAIWGTEIHSVFKHPCINGRYAPEMIRHAIGNGGTMLDCFSHISYIYQEQGFVTYRTEQWSDSCAPKDWDNAIGKPNVNYMKLAS